MELKRAIHAAMGGILNRICAGVDVATGPRCAADLNAIEEHQAKSTLIHPDKCSCQNSAIRQGRTIGREFGHHDVINRGFDQKGICMFLCFVGACQHFFFAGKIRT
jgi:hypothetical protein